MKQSSRLHQPDIEGSVGLSPFEQFNAFVSVLRPKDGSTEIWFKLGHNKFLVGEFDYSGRFKIYTTKGTGADRQRDYEISDGFDRLSRAARSQDGGVFYIPTQPIGAPTKEAVTSTDDIGIELDSLTREEQLERYAEFTRVTGLEWALLLSSGGKSIHAHLKLDEHYPVEQAQFLRQLVCLGLRSDPVTARLHQPMRVPGFWRKEKQALQELLSVSQARYSTKQAIEGLRKWFDHLGWQFPESLGEDWWREKFHPLLKGCAKHTEQYKLDTARELLASGEAAFLSQKEEQKQARESRQTEQQVYSARRQSTGETNLVDLVNQTSAQLGSNAFNWTGHNWKFTGDHARGCCPFHQSASGSSAWIAPADNGWTFHCTACTDDKSISPFTYWLYLRDGFNTSYPKGREWVEAAKQFLSEHGVSAPDFAPGQGFGQSQDTDKGKGKKKTWEQKRFEAASAAASRRALLKERMAVVEGEYWDELKKDVLLTRSDIQYQGYCPAPDLSKSSTHLIQGGLGSGKTQAMLEALRRADCKTVIWITTRNGLLAQTRSRGEKMGLEAHHYQNDVGGIRQSINLSSAGLGFLEDPALDLDVRLYTMADASLKPYATGGFSWEKCTVVIDEFCSVRKSIHQKVDSFGQFEELMARAGTLILADAFLSDIDRGIVKKYRGGQHRQRIVYQQIFQQSGVKIRWVEALKKLKKDERENGIEQQISFTHEGIYFELVDREIEDTQGNPGLRAIACHSKTTAKVRARYLEGHSFKVKLCTSETVDSNRGFLSDPDHALAGYDWVIYTPTAESGLDIQAPVVSGLMLDCGVLSPTATLQMMGRCRKCPVWTVSAPRYQVGGKPPRLDAANAVELAEHFDQLFDAEGIESSKRSGAWQQWDSAVSEVCKQFGSEYLYKLLEYFHSNVETVLIDPMRDHRSWRDSVLERPIQI